MNVETKQLRSVESPDDPHPWYVVEVDEADGEVRVTEDKDGGRESGLSTAAAATPDSVDYPEAASTSASGDVTYAVTEAGDLVSYDPNDPDADVPPLRAHLAWYTADDDTITVLEFVEP